MDRSYTLVHHPSRPLVRILTMATLIIVIASALLQTGCYRRVVRAEGIGADQRYEVYEPNLKDDEVKESVWYGGTKKAAPKKAAIK